MEYTHLGRSGLTVSRLVLGTMNFGPRTSETDSHAILDAALDAGVTFVDTADVYGRHGDPDGKVGDTEQILGRWFAQGGDRRERTVLATKVYGRMSDRPGDEKLSARHIRHALDASLRRLQTDHVDVYQFHHVDRDTPWDEIWQAVDVAVAQGKVLYAASSNFAGWHIATAQEAARRRGALGLVSEQSLYNLLVRDIEREVIPAAQANGLGIIPWSPLQGGLLGGVVRATEQGERRLEAGAAAALEKHRDAITAYEDLAAELGVPAGDLGLAWLLHRPGVTGPIVGPRTMDQLTSALRAVDLHLDDATLSRLDEIFPGPKPAPEDYAW